MITLNKKFRLVWDVSTKYIQNNYEKDYNKTITMISNNGTLDTLESDVYQDILDKIAYNNLKEKQEKTEEIFEEPIISEDLEDTEII
jgi:hypothetical protein